MAGAVSPRLWRLATATPDRSQVQAVVFDASFIVVCVLIFELFVRTFLVQVYSVPSGSMENTLRVGDVLVVSRISPRFTDLHRGDIVVFRDPGGWLNGQKPDHVDSTLRNILVFIGLIPENSGEHLVKRVIGLGGDKVACGEQGVVTVNGVPVDEPYRHPGDPACQFPFDVTVPADCVWVLGDHRSASADSRFHLYSRDGGVPVSSVIGRVFAVSSSDSGLHLT